MVRIRLNKTVIDDLNNLNKGEREKVYSYLMLLEKSKNPFRFGYETITEKIGDILFYVTENRVLISRIENENIRIITLI